MSLTEKLQRLAVGALWSVCFCLPPSVLYGQQIDLEVLVHQDYQYTQYHLDRDQGLRGNLIYGLTQDSKGYIWLITNEWVQRYNGAGFETFWQIPEAYGYALQLIADKDDRIWVSKFTSDMSGPVSKVEMVDLWVIFPETRQVLNAEEIWKWQNYDFERSAVICIAENKRDTTILFGLADGRVVNANLGGKLAAQVVDGGISQIATNRSGMIAISGDEDLVLMDSLGNTLDDHHFEQSNVKGISLDGSGGMLFDRLSLGTYKASQRYIPRSGSPQSYLPGFDLNLDRERISDLYFADENFLVGRDAIFKHGQPAPWVQCSNCPRLYLDRQQNVWTTNFTGLTVIRPAEARFRTLLTKYHPETRGILPLGDSLLMVNSYKGAFVVDLNDSVRMYYPQLNANLGIARDRTGRIWKGVHGIRIEYMTDYRNAFTSASLSGPSILKHEQYPIFPLVTTDDELYFGTNAGVLYFSLKDRAVPESSFSIPHPALEGATVHYLEEVDSLIWAATSAGLFEIDPRRHQVVRHHQALKELNINHFAVDSQTIWCSSYSNGLIRWEYGADHYSALPLAEEGPFVVVPSLCAVYDDGLGYLWLPSNIGLYRFKKETGGYHRYDGKQHIAHEEFNYYSHARLPDGRLVFGGLNGLTLIDPSRINLLEKTEPPFQLQLTDGWITGGRASRKISIRNNSPISFYGQKEILEMKCHLLDFRSKDKGQIAYQLAGLDTEWKILQGDVLRLERIPYGDYELLVRGITSDNLSKGNEWIIPIRALKPWYLQTWFAILLSFFISAMVALRFHKVKLAKIQLEKLVEKRTEEITRHRNLILSQNDELKLLNEYRNKLMALMGHDLRGPILGLSNMTRKFQYFLSNGDMERLYLLCSDGEKQVEHLRNLIDNIMAWSLVQSKTEIGFNHAPKSLGEVVEDQLEIVDAAAGIKKQTIEFALKQDACFPINRFVLGVLIRNILTNSIRYSPEGTSIFVEVAAYEDHPGVLVRDEGPGMPPILMQTLNDFGELKRPIVSAGQEGMGLGLWICSSLLRSLGGKWRFTDSPSGNGLQVRLWFANLDGAGPAEKDQQPYYRTSGK